MDHIRLIASDMDATLLDERSQLPPDFAETIRALAGQGILFAAASGRPLANGSTCATHSMSAGSLSRRSCVRNRLSVLGYVASFFS